MRSLVICICLYFILPGCDPVKRIQKDIDAMNRMESIMLSRGICRPDTLVITKSDTTTRVDTTAVIYIFTDTITEQDTTIITREKIRTILRTMTIRDTILRQIVDQAGLDACRESMRINDAMLNESKEAVRVRGYAIGLLCVLILAMIFISLSK